MDCVVFTFHYVSISTLSEGNKCYWDWNLHSTMYLFQHTFITSKSLNTDIYIPLCIYFNNFVIWKDTNQISIYIPLCIYFNTFRGCFFLFRLIFTFHYVSISTATLSYVLQYNYYLHSTMYLFQQDNHSIDSVRYANLHSTMYLFQQGNVDCKFILDRNLHSTMYLFQQ